MRVGLTYDLRSAYRAEGFGDEDVAEFDREDTIDAIEGALREIGCQTDRIGHVRALTARLAAGDRWDLVFNIAEGMYGIGREAQVPALLDAFRIPYTFSDPVALAACLDKGLTKRVLRDCGIPTPAFAVVARAGDARRVDLTPPLFVKPVAEGTGKGIGPQSRIDDPSALEAACARLIARFGQPALVETYLPGREFTVGILGTGDDARPVGTMEVRLRPQADQGAYSYAAKEDCETLVDYPPATGAEADEAGRLALASWRALGCRDAGRVDLRADADGRLNVLELNPLAGMHPTHSDLPMICTQNGISYQQLIDRILRSAAARAGLRVGRDAAAR